MATPYDTLTAQVASLAATLSGEFDVPAATRAIFAHHGTRDIREIDDLWSIIGPHIVTDENEIIDRILVAIYTTSPGQSLQAELGNHVHLHMVGVSHASPLPNTLARAVFTCLTRPPETIASRHLTWERLTATAIALRHEYLAARDACLEDLAETGESVQRLKEALAEAVEERQRLIREAHGLRIKQTDIASTGMISRQGVHRILANTDAEHASPEADA